MSSASASTSKPAETKTAEQAKEEEETRPHLGVLEEDDEFEEFAVAGTFTHTFTSLSFITTFYPHRLGRLADRPGASRGSHARRCKIWWRQALGG
jgi:hypothetical protein